MIKGRTAFFAKLSVEGGHEARLLRNNLGRFSVPLTGFTSSVVLKRSRPWSNGSLPQKIEGQRGQRDARCPHFMRSGVSRHSASPKSIFGPLQSGNLILALSGQDQQLENALVRIAHRTGVAPHRPQLAFGQDALTHQPSPDQPLGLRWPSGD
jgi:hypothetical protein